MVKSLRLLPLLATLSAGCQPVYDVADGFKLQPVTSTTCTQTSPDCKPAVPFEIKKINCAAPTIDIGGLPTDASVNLVFQPRPGVLAELTPTENCTGKNASTRAKMTCTVPTDQLSAEYAAATRYQIDLVGKGLLPNAQLISGLGIINIGAPMMPPAVSQILPVSIYKVSAEVPPGDIPWNISIVGLKTWTSNELQVEFQTLVSCPGTIYLPGAVKFHWELDTLKVTLF